ncbi:MAG TPA: hypothetical protein VJN21_08295 [Candidatus Acidoferrales bacterium]|nr:hypothetical protein [Candidatus Acidoferrales bacterium]
MFSAFIFVLSVAMAAQFAIHFWRSAFLAKAAQPVSERIQMAQEGISNALKQNDFGAISSLTQICPDLGATESSFGAVRVYYQLLRGVAAFSKSLLPQASKWAQKEMAACTRFVAVSMDARLKANEALLADLRSY